LYDVGIHVPLEGAQLSGLVEVLGIANVPDFAYYELLYGPGDAPEPDAWQTAAGRRLAPVRSGVLAAWDVSGLPAGRYTLRLSVATGTGMLWIADRRVDVLPTH
jgi:hypothetical protein